MDKPNTMSNELQKQWDEVAESLEPGSCAYCGSPCVAEIVVTDAVRLNILCSNACCFGSLKDIDATPLSTKPHVDVFETVLQWHRQKYAYVEPFPPAGAPMKTLSWDRCDELKELCSPTVGTWICSIPSGKFQRKVQRRAQELGIWNKPADSMYHVFRPIDFQFGIEDPRFWAWVKRQLKSGAEFTLNKNGELCLSGRPLGKTTVSRMTWNRRRGKRNRQGYDTWKRRKLQNAKLQAANRVDPH